MPRLISRAQLLHRVRVTAHELGLSGPWTDQQLTEHLQYAIDDVWEDLSAQEDGPGRVYEEFTIAAGDPLGRVPGQAIPLPALLMRLVDVWRGFEQSLPGRPDRAELKYRGQISLAAGGWYWIDGSTQGRTGGGALDLDVATLLMVPEFAEGDGVTWLYVQQPPLVVDPTDPSLGPDGILTAAPTIAVTIDLDQPAVVNAVIAEAVSRAVARNDQEALARAERARAGAREQYLRRKRDRVTSARTLEQFATTRRRYGI